MLAAVVVGLVVPGGTKRRDSSDLPFGPDAGYLYVGHVTSVRASFTVPRIVHGSPLGLASTWIGAQTPGPRFIQVGIYEERIRGAHNRVSSEYRAVWSDIAHHYAPQFLFHVNPGDGIAVGLTLAHKRWTVRIADERTGRKAEFSTGEESDGSFRWAEWAQEDPGGHGIHAPYPQLTPTVFRRLAVDSAAPAQTDLYSLWMSVSEGTLAPSPLHEDSFALRRPTVTAAGKQYLSLIAPLDAASTRFEARLSKFNAQTPYVQIATASSQYITSIRRTIHSLSAARWPNQNGSMVRSLIHALLQEAEEAQPPAVVTRATLAAWRAELSQASEIAPKLRRALGLPINSLP